MNSPDWFPARHCGDKLITRAEIERATAEYLAQGGTITRIETCIFTEDHQDWRILPCEYDSNPFCANRKPNAPVFSLVSDIIYYG
jgi:hypothetical protein